MNEDRYKRDKSAEGKEAHADVWLERIRRNATLMNYIEKHYQPHQRRIGLLEDIFHGMEEGREKETKYDIYTYGSLIQEQDLAARQLFLWLLGALEEMERTEIE